MIAFFRDPKRITPEMDGAIISPGDGVVTNIDYQKPPAELKIDEPMLRISIFLSVFNCHVNRLPVSGHIDSVTYKPGLFISASLDKDNHNNERNSMVINSGGQKFVLIQIAGLIARRIVCYKKAGDDIKKGERYGIIRFGSRLDLYMPKDTKLFVKEGSTTVGGETILGSSKPIEGNKVEEPKKIIEEIVEGDIISQNVTFTDDNKKEEKEKD